MSTIITKFIGVVKKHPYSDVVDQLNYYYTTLIILFFALFTACEQKLGSPIKCWVPSEFRSGWESYVDTYCYISNTYHLPLNVSVGAKEQAVYVNYYHWVPLILLLQAGAFFFIDALWRSINLFVGFTFEKINENMCFIIYLLIKLLYLFNVCTQFYVINTVFKNGYDWLFPFVTLCDFEVREMGNLHKYTVQCLLPINMLNEKLYIFLWFWFLIVITCIFFNIVYWCHRKFINVGNFSKP